MSGDQDAEEVSGYASSRPNEDTEPGEYEGTAAPDNNTGNWHIS
jgi:hypothetical protein